MIQKIPLFDLGNVIVKVDFTPFLSWLSHKNPGFKTESVSDFVHSSLFSEFEFGHLSPQEVAVRLGETYGANVSVEEFTEKFNSIFPGLMDGAASILQDLSGSVYCLSNTNEIHLSYLKKRFPELGHFKKIFSSHEMHLRKPSLKIYHQVAAELGVDPSVLVFFDDLPSNVEGARAAGLEAHVFQSCALMGAQLKESGVLVDKGIRE